MLITFLEYRFLFSLGLAIIIGLILVIWGKSLKWSLVGAIVSGAINFVFAEVLIAVLFGWEGP